MKSIAIAATALALLAGFSSAWTKDNEPPKPKLSDAAAKKLKEAQEAKEAQAAKDAEDASRAQAAKEAQLKQQQLEEARKYFVDGLSAYKGGNLSIAEELFIEGLRRSPNDATAQYFLAEIFRKKGKLDWALQLYESSIQINPDSRYAIPAQGAAMELQEQIAISRKQAAAKQLFAEGYDLMKAGDLLTARGKFVQGLGMDANPQAKALLSKIDNQIRIKNDLPGLINQLVQMGFDEKTVRGLYANSWMADAPVVRPFKDLVVLAGSHRSQTSCKLLEFGVAECDLVFLSEIGGTRSKSKSTTLRLGNIYSIITGSDSTKYSSFEKSVIGNPFDRSVGSVHEIKTESTRKSPSGTDIVENYKIKSTVQSVETIQIGVESFLLVKSSYESILDHKMTRRLSDGQTKWSDSLDLRIRGTMVTIPELGLSAITSDTEEKTGVPDKTTNYDVTIESINGVAVGRKL